MLLVLVVSSVFVAATALLVDGWRTAMWILVAGSVSTSALLLMPPRQVTPPSDDTRAASPPSDDTRLLTLLNTTAAELLDRTLAERDRLASELEHLAFRDPLTGLADRARFQRELDEHGSGRTVLLIDLDDFRSVNDMYGHAAGDAVLAAVALRLRAGAAPGDLVARLSGDEFALLSAGTLTEDEARAKAADLAAEIRLPMTIRGHEVRVDASIGIATGGAGETGSDLLHDADIAVYWAKRSGAATSAPLPEQRAGHGELHTRADHHRQPHPPHAENGQ